MKEVLIIGGGVSGTSLAYTLARYTNVEDIMIIDKYSSFGEVSSRADHNSQTLHVGDIETNIVGEKRKKVHREASYLRRFLEDHGDEHYMRTPKMVFAVGKEEVADLRKRYTDIAQFYPDLKLVEKDEIYLYEPNLMNGRDSEEEVLALVTTGYTVDYGATSKLFIGEAKKHKDVEVGFGYSVKEIIRKNGYYEVHTDKGTIKTRTVAVMAGAYSLAFAKSLGYGKHLEILPVSGNFYFAKRAGILNGKVYTMQIPGIPFAAVHGDPDILDASVTRFGPTAMATLLFEKFKLSSAKGFFQSVVWTARGIATFIAVAANPQLLKFILKNVPYYLPYIGKYFFIKEIRKIVPSLSVKDIYYGKNYGGIRPQVVNTRTMKLEMGESQIDGDGVIFNITPSPGASVCMGGAYRNAPKFVEFLGQGYTFYQDKWDEDMTEKPVEEKEFV